MANMIKKLMFEDRIPQQNKESTNKEHKRTKNGCVRIPRGRKI